MPVRVTCWQSYSSRRSSPRQFSKCSRATSVMRRQLSSSRTRSLSWPQVLLLRCRIPSSVMSSQWDRLWKGKEHMFTRPSHSKAHGLGEAGELACTVSQSNRLWTGRSNTKPRGPSATGLLQSWAVVSLAFLTKKGNQNCRGRSGSWWQHKRIWTHLLPWTAYSCIQNKFLWGGGLKTGCASPRWARERRPTAKQ